VLLTQTQQFPQAIETWKRYADASGSDAAALSNLAFCYELAGKLSDAQQTYEQGIAKDPKSEACRVNYGLMLARAGRTNEAIIQFKAVLSEAQVHYNLASVYQQQGKRDQAKAEYRRAIELDPSLKDSLGSVADVR